MKRDDEGFTLIELMVVVLIMGIVTFMVLNFFDGMQKTVGRATNDVFSENELRIALRTMTEDIRAAKPGLGNITFTSPTACPATPSASNCLRFTVLRTTAANPTCQSIITYGLVGTLLKSTRTDSNCAQNRAFTNKTVIGSVVNGSAAVFTYYDDNGNILSASQSSAATVKVTLNVEYQKNAPVLSISSFAALRNAR